MGSSAWATTSAREVFVDGSTRQLGDVTIQVGLRFLGGLDELAELVAAYAALGARRVVASLPVRPAELDARLGAIAGSLGVTPAAMA